MLCECIYGKRLHARIPNVWLTAQLSGDNADTRPGFQQVWPQKAAAGLVFPEKVYDSPGRHELSNPASKRIEQLVLYPQMRTPSSVYPQDYAAIGKVVS